MHDGRVLRSDKDDRDVDVIGCQTAAGFDARHSAQIDVENRAGDILKAVADEVLPGSVDLSRKSVRFDESIKSAQNARFVVDDGYLFSHFHYRARSPLLAAYNYKKGSTQSFRIGLPFGATVLLFVKSAGRSCHQGRPDVRRWTQAPPATSPGTCS